jgi:hypothetical protein
VTPEEQAQAQACEEFRAGLALLRMSVAEFAELTGSTENAAKAFYKGKSAPPEWALGYMRLMVFWSISFGAAWAVNGPDGADMRAELARRLGPERAAQLVSLRPRPASPERS